MSNCCECAYFAFELFECVVSPLSEKPQFLDCYICLFVSSLVNLCTSPSTYLLLNFEVFKL
jgi:hypothetical protein